MSKPDVTDMSNTGGEAKAGLALMAAAVLAMIVANSPLSAMYNDVLHSKLSLGIAPLALSKDVLHWINDGLMAIFFFVVGLEIKREVAIGALSNRKTAMLPVIAAIGGMIVPAMIYVAVNWGDQSALRGWAIPAATDIAFAVGVLALLGNRVPVSLKIFLLALAIIDDLGAIIIIALFYSANLSWMSLLLAAAGLLVLWGFNRSNITNVWPYIIVGLVVWLCVVKSGVHATIAGVATALMIPIAGARGTTARPLEALEHALVPWVSFAIVPIFAFANAGVSLHGVSPANLLAPVPLGIALGLFLGKAVGIYGFARTAISAGFSEMPKGASHAQLFGVAVIGGIGFTMSLFIGTLAFPDPSRAADLRIGVLTGSILSAVAGYLILSQCHSRTVKRGA
ncbi:MAG TPA: Na+/H+ antiporter NhaA [Hyphomicrobium sp.]|nr:Na+/H+ antiporter NhaA [Hyphomicrobium sp.]